MEARVRLRQELAGLGSVSEFDSLLSEGSINLWFTLESSADEHRSYIEKLTLSLDYSGPEYAVSMRQVEGEETTEWEWHSATE